MKNICLSLVTNMGCGLSDQVLDGFEVLEEGKKALGRIGALVSKIAEKFQLQEGGVKYFDENMVCNLDMRTSTYQEGDMSFNVQKVKDAIKNALKDTKISKAYWFFDIQKGYNKVFSIEDIEKMHVITFGTMLQNFEFRMSEAFKKTALHHVKL